MDNNNLFLKKYGFNKRHKILMHAIIILSLLNLFTVCDSITTNSVQQDSPTYEEFLDTVLSNISSNDSISVDLIIKTIPANQAEFAIYYSNYTDESKRESFLKLDNLIGDYAYEDKGDFLSLYIRMSQFIYFETVDDDYLENYYYDLDYIIEKNNSRFCEIYKNMTSTEVKYVKDFHEDYCL